MKSWKFYIAVAFGIGLLLPAQAQPLEKPAEAELPHISVAQLSTLVGGPTKVSLHYENAELDTVIKEVSKKFAVPIALLQRTGAKGLVTFDLQDAPLWTVWETLRAQVQYDREGPKASARRSLLLLPVTTPDTTCETPLFQVRTSGLRTHAKGWSMAFYFVADPKVDIALSASLVRLTEAVDEQGNPFSVENVRATWISSTVPSLFYTSLSQTGAKPTGKKLARLRGVLTAYAILQREDWEMPLEKLPAEKIGTHDGVKEILSVSAVQPEETKERYNVELNRAFKSLIAYRFWNGAQTRANWAYTSALFAKVQLQDGQGRSFYLRQIKRDDNYENEFYFYNWIGQFERTPEDRQDSDILPEGEPVKLIWSVPTAIYRFELPFELTDVPIN